MNLKYIKVTLFEIRERNELFHHIFLFFLHVYGVANEVNGGRCSDWGLGAYGSPTGFCEMKS